MTNEPIDVTTNILISIRDEIRATNAELRDTNAELRTTNTRLGRVEDRLQSLEQLAVQSHHRLEAVEEGLRGFSAQVTLFSASVSASFEQRARMESRFDSLTERVERLERG